MNLKELYDASPFGMVSSLFYGTIQSALFTLLAVYATSMNFSILEISIVTFLLATSLLAQFPIGKFSIFMMKSYCLFNFGASIFSIIAILVSRQMYLPDGLATSKTWFYIFFVLFSFCSLPMFSLILAHTSDHISKDKFVTGQGFNLLWVGCNNWSFLCSIFGYCWSNGFFVFIFLSFYNRNFGIYRMKVRETVDNPDSQFVAMPQTITPAGIELNPTTEPIEDPAKEENQSN